MGPFPKISRDFWSYLLDYQEQNKVKGDLAEIGVERGSTALSLIYSARSNKNFVHLYDIIEDEIFTSKIRSLEPSWSDFYQLNITDSTKLDATCFPNSCRWIHIDGGHLYHHVSSDLKLVDRKLGNHGILVVDDFFEPRWPDVTLATIDWMKENSQLSSFALVDRKLYLCQSHEHDFYRTAMQKIVSSMKNLGYRCWEEELFDSKDISIIKV
jgi:hypothetical protein